MNSSAKDVNRRVFAIQAKKKRHKPNKKKDKPSAALGNKNQNSSSNYGGEYNYHNKYNNRYDNDYSLSDESHDEEENENKQFSSDEDEQEDPNDYCKGGYHPVKIGMLFNNRYRVTRKLGWGHFSTVCCRWPLIQDIEKKNQYKVIFMTNPHVLVSPQFPETALDEIKLLKCVRDGDVNDPYRERVVQLLDDFKICGVNGTHVCMVFEVLGHNLLKLIVKSKYRGIPLENVRSIIRQILQGLNYLHTKCRIIHTDIKPENVLLCVDEARVKTLALNATELAATGHKLPVSFCSTAPVQEYSEVSRRMSKNKKKKLKKKAKKENEMLMKQMKQIEELDVVSSSPKCNSGSSQCNTTQGKRSNNRYCTNLNNNSDSHGDSSLVNNIGSEQLATPGAIEPQSSLDDPDDSLAEESESVQAPNNEDEEDLLESESLSTAQDTVVASENQVHRENGLVDGGSRGREGEVRPEGETVKREADPSREVCDIDVKIADLGNACWVDKHFTEDVQTRQYRSLEVLINAGYDCSADIWSVACMAFELATGDYLFEPHAGDTYTRDEDHLAHIIELLGDIPKRIIQSGHRSSEFFTKKGELRHIPGLKPWDLYSVLVEKYNWTPESARGFSEFLRPMLAYDPKLRATAADCLQHPWLQN
ncbi:SRSF protein kinase 3-like [Diaphorina citri]|uniref:non-specific serine/threonine protein kinase n=1 Tax=Diaphorina citri TaxID=121845 RepID=A0A3Q0J3H2_DIACI|nr:SRSF protein kinase 3-like [Diaphorina citri]